MMDESDRPASASARALLFGALAFVVIRLLSALNYEIVFDEVFTLALVDRGWSELLGAIARYDYHPPLFYVLLKFWIAIGDTSSAWLGLLPALIAAASIVPVLLLCREIGLSRRATALAVALMAPNAFLIGYSQELRMYGLLLLLATTSMWLFSRVATGRASRRTWVALTLVNVLVVYTQYYGWLLIGSEGLALLVAQRAALLRFVISTAVVVAAFAPWALAVFDETAARVASGQEALYFIAPPTWFSVAALLSAVTGELPLPRATTVNLLFFGFPVAVWLLNRLGTRGPERAPHLWVLPALAFAPVAVAYGASHVLAQSVWGQRHLIFVAIPYVLLLAGAVDRLRPRLRAAMMCGMVIWAGAAAASASTKPYNRPGWDRLLTLAGVTGPEQVYAVDEHAGWLVAFHAQRQGLAGIRVAVVKPDTDVNRRVFVQGNEHRPLWASALRVVLADKATEFPDETFWLAHRASRPGIKQCLERAGYEIASELSGASHTRRQVEGIALYRVSKGRDITPVSCQTRVGGEWTDDE